MAHGVRFFWSWNQGHFGHIYRDCVRMIEKGFKHDKDWVLTLFICYYTHEERFYGNGKFYIQGYLRNIRKPKM